MHSRITRRSLNQYQVILSILRGTHFYTPNMWGSNREHVCATMTIAPWSIFAKSNLKKSQSNHFEDVSSKTDAIVGEHEFHVFSCGFASNFYPQRIFLFSWTITLANNYYVVVCCCAAVWCFCFSSSSFQLFFKFQACLILFFVSFALCGSQTHGNTHTHVFDVLLLLLSPPPPPPCRHWCWCRCCHCQRHNSTTTRRKKKLNVCMREYERAKPHSLPLTHRCM